MNKENKKKLIHALFLLALTIAILALIGIIVNAPGFPICAY